jgi:CspA family cold shock protein
MATGTVKWFDATKGFGFIVPDEGGKDVFVHISAVERAGLQTLKDNQKITYELEEGRNGRLAAAQLQVQDD